VASEEQIARAASLLRAGGLVAFPTETVYGLGANALDAAAVRRIYAAKGRPSTSPLIVHIESEEQAREYAAAWPEQARTLAHWFWPGPLTLVVPKTAAIVDEATGGLPTVGLRAPAHPVALALIRAAGVPIAAPSANRFTALSPTRAEHVRASLGDAVDLILDGGPTVVGIESTVLSLAGERPVLLRPGAVTRADIEEKIGPVDTHAETVPGAAHVSPGLHPRHYAPATRLLLVEHVQTPPEGSGVYLAPGAGLPADPRDYAAALYATLHELDQQGLDWIAIERPPATPEWEAVRDRLTRAATP
jgi:L-threonylcarbamoyladenylate synthase